MFRNAVCAVAVGFLAAGIAAAAEAIRVSLSDFKIRGDLSDDLFGYDEIQDRLFFYTNGAMEAEVKLPEDGEYTITVEASCDEALDEKAKFKLTIGDEVVAKEHTLTQLDPKTYTFTAKLKKGEAKLAIEFLNDAFSEGEYDRNLYVHAVKLEKKK
jgi:hypothetical protein